MVTSHRSTFVAFVALLASASLSACGPTDGGSGAGPGPLDTPDDELAQGSQELAAAAVKANSCVKSHISSSYSIVGTPQFFGAGSFWRVPVKLPGKLPTQVFIDNGAVCGVPSNIQFARRRNPPQGTGETEAECQGCYWLEHTTHSHGGCGDHRHEICRNWNARTQTCFHNPTGHYECL